MRTLKQWIQVSICVWAISAVVLPATVYAHGNAKARHGGIAQMAQDLEFELVAQPDAAVIYVVDHDQPLATKGMSGKLTVLRGSQKTEAPLQEAGTNQLRATGVKLEKGDKVVATIQSSKGKTTTVRFVVR